MATPAGAAAEADWEASKENFQPLKTGRKATALRDSTAELRGQAIEAQRRSYLEELAVYSGEDPLEVWLRFIRWTQDTFSAGGHKAELMPLLERATRELQDAAGGRYRGDVRYLRLWVQYADCLPDPGDVFAFLKEHDIGQEHALYYAAFATYLEARGAYARADSIYQQGVNRLAAPVDRLRGRYREFQERMAKRIQRKAQEQAAEGPPEAEHPERKSLGLLGARRGGRTGGGGLAGGLKRKADAENVSALANGGGGLDIFVDEEFCGGGGGGAAAASAPPALLQPGRSAAGGAAWTKLAGFEAGRKENVQRAGAWAGQKLRQASAHSAPAAPALEVFADPELQEAEQAAAPAADAAKPTLRQRLDRGGGGGGGAPEDERLMQDPLQLHKAQAGLPEGGLPGRPAPEAQPAKRRREEALAFDAAALLGDGGEERCFEEVRAAAWLRRAAEAAGAAASGQLQEEEEEQLDMELEGNTCALPLLLPAAAAQSAVKPAAQAAVAAGGQEKAGPTAAARLPSAFGSPVEAEAGAEARQAELQAVWQSAAAEQAPCSPSAAVSAQAAHAQAAAVGASPHDRPASPGPAPPRPLPTPFDAAASGGGWGEPTVTLNTLDAFAAINQMFGGSLPQGGLGSESGGCAAAASLEPTVTIGAKEAFAAVNAMFKGALPLEPAATAPQQGRGEAAAMQLPRRDGGYEPTMTISTKAAFDAINQMFKGALPGEHGCLPPTARGPAGGYEPTVTISTRAAFEAVNQMFGGGAALAATSGAPQPLGVLAAQPPGIDGFRPPAPRQRAAVASVHAAVAPPQLLESPGEAGGFCIREDTQFVSVPLGDGDGGDGEADSPDGPALGARVAASASGFAIHEDTQFITVPAAAEEDEDGQEGGRGGTAAPHGVGGGGGSFLIREDTQYITVPLDDDGAASDCSTGKGCEDGQPAALTGGSWEQAAAASEPRRDPLAGLSGFCIREDTQFVGAAAAPLAAAESPSPAGGQGPAGGADAATAAPRPSALLPRKRPFGEHAAGGDSTADSLAADGGGGLTWGGDERSPAQSANGEQVGKWGFAPGADDTLALILGQDLDLGDTQALLEAMPAASQDEPEAAAAAVPAGGSGAVAGGSPALAAHLQALQLADNKENLLGESVAAGGGGGGRRLEDPAVAAGVLCPLSKARAAALGGVEVEWDEEAEAALAAAGLPQGDAFAVWADPAEGAASGSLPLMASPPASSGGSQTGPEWRPHAGLEAEEGEGPGFATPMQQGNDEAAAALDPFSPSFRGRLLSCLEPAVPEWPGVLCLSGDEEEAAEAGFRAASRGAAELTELQLAGLEFAVSGVIGRGAYACVYQGVDGDCADVALKVEAPPCPWEWYLCKALAGRIPDAARPLFADPTALLLGQRCSVLVAPLGPAGTLQDLVNAYLARGQTPPEPLAMHFAAQLLRILQHLHAARVLHTDIKPDNLLISLEEGGGAEGEAGAGPGLGLQLIDFGRGLDLELLPPGVVLQGDSGTDSFRCVEMREGRPWTWQADAYGAAATAHCLLMGRYLEVERVRDAATGAVSLRPALPFKRHWAGELWSAFFSRLLNHTDLSCPPELDDLIAAFEGHLHRSRDAAQALRQELSRAAALLPRRC